MKSPLAGTSSLVLTLIVGSSAFAPSPLGCGTVGRVSASCQPRRTQQLGALYAKPKPPQPREGEREEDFDSEGLGEIACGVLVLSPSADGVSLCRLKIAGILTTL